MRSIAFPFRASFTILLVIVIFLAALGVGLWYVSAARYRAAINAWVDERRAAGYEISFENRETLGFPRRVTIRLVDVHWKDARGIDFRADRLDLAAQPWNFKDFKARIKGHASLSVPMENDRALLLAGNDIRAHIRLDAHEKWRDARLSLRDGTIGLTPHHLFQAERLSAFVARPVTPPKNYHDVGLTIEGDADKVDLSGVPASPFGPTASHASVRLRVMGAMPDVRNRNDVDGWNKNSGIIEFDDFSILWGVLDLASKGTLGFDDDLQPEGAFAGTFGNPEKTMQALMDYNLISAREMSLITSAMNVFAKESARRHTKQEFPITVQMGGLFFGPIRIFTFPEIEWANEPATAAPAGNGE